MPQAEVEIVGTGASGLSAIHSLRGHLIEANPASQNLARNIRRYLAQEV